MGHHHHQQYRNNTKNRTSNNHHHQSALINRNFNNNNNNNKNAVDLPYGVLTYQETVRLCGILSSIIPIDAKQAQHGISINAPLALVIQQAREELINAGFVLSSVRLNGGAAVACL